MGSSLVITEVVVGWENERLNFRLKSPTESGSDGRPFEYQPFQILTLLRPQIHTSAQAHFVVARQP